MAGLDQHASHLGQRLAIVTNRPLISSVFENSAEKVGLAPETLDLDDSTLAAKLTEPRPACVLVDVSGDFEAAVGACRALTSIESRPPFVLLITCDRSVPPRAFAAMLACKPVGMLGPASTPEELVHAVRLVIDGQAVFQLDRSANSVELLERWWRSAANEVATELSSEEAALMRMLTVGLSDSEIASRFYVSQPTVRRRLVALRRKTATGNRAELAAWGGAHGYYEARNGEGPPPFADVEP